jgi:hypothetical protein
MGFSINSPQLWLDLLNETSAKSRRKWSFSHMSQSIRDIRSSQEEETRKHNSEPESSEQDSQPNPTDKPKKESSK